MTPFGGPGEERDGHGSGRPEDSPPPAARDASEARGEDPRADSAGPFSAQEDPADEVFRSGARSVGRGLGAGTATGTRRPERVPIEELTPATFRADPVNVRLPAELPAELTPWPERLRVQKADGSKPTMGERIGTVWELSRHHVDDLVELAEVTLGPDNGETKRDFVKSRVLRWLYDLEAKFDLIPGWLEGILFRAIEFGLGIMIERAVAAMKARGGPR